MRHHLALINSFLADHNEEAAQIYIAEVEKNIDDATIQKYCSNYTVNFIQIANSYEGNVAFADDLPVSTREDHGFVTRSIAAVTQKYSGVYSFSAEDGIFTTSVIL
ncbi:MAG: hypothetical protein K0Q48_2691 [Bacillota bacterium]|jgi:hypothetical protein|nr:hypothetical protein [Bacillota bacterium]